MGRLCQARRESEWNFPECRRGLNTGRCTSADVRNNEHQSPIAPSNLEDFVPPKIGTSLLQRPGETKKRHRGDAACTPSVKLKAEATCLFQCYKRRPASTTRMTVGQCHWTWQASLGHFREASAHLQVCPKGHGELNSIPAGCLTIPRQFMLATARKRVGCPYRQCHQKDGATSTKTRTDETIATTVAAAGPMQRVFDIALPWGGRPSHCRRGNHTHSLPKKTRGRHDF
jgi:hypothetical protein